MKNKINELQTVNQFQLEKNPAFFEKVISLFTFHFSLKCAAFTLAETLITLGIIGVVAALTLPTLIQFKQNKELEAGLKKAYSTLEQALNMYYIENGERITPKTSPHKALHDDLKKYLNVIKDCGLYYSCSGHVDNFIYKNYSNEYLSSSEFDDGQFILNDGSFIMLETLGNRFISVDVNGYKKNPNKLGHDLFMFQIDNNGKLLPMGVKGTKYYNASDKYCSKTSTSDMNGAGCTYKALTDKNFFKNLPK